VKMFSGLLPLFWKIHQQKAGLYGIGTAVCVGHGHNRLRAAVVPVILTLLRLVAYLLRVYGCLVVRSWQIISLQIGHEIGESKPILLALISVVDEISCYSNPRHKKKTCQSDETPAGQ
jgi:hypothetical protein